MRVKEVTVDEAKYRITALTTDQVDDLLGAGADVKGTRIVRDHMAPIIAASFNNAITGDGDWYEGVDSFPKQKRDRRVESMSMWRPKDVTSSLEYPVAIELYKAICDMTKLSTNVREDGKEVKTETAAGEAKAVTPTLQ